MQALKGLVLGKEYTLKLSDALLELDDTNVPDAEKLVALQYRFKPPVDKEANGEAFADAASHRWTVRLPAAGRKSRDNDTKSSSSTSALGVDDVLMESFQGTQLQKGGEGLLEWASEDESFVLHAVETTVQLSHVPNTDATNATSMVAGVAGGNSGAERLKKMRKSGPSSRKRQAKEKPVEEPTVPSASAADASITTKRPRRAATSTKS